MIILVWIGHVMLALLALIIAGAIGALPFWLPTLLQKSGQQWQDKK